MTDKTTTDTLKLTDWIAEFIGSLEEDNYSEASIKTKQFHFGKFMDWASMRAITEIDEVTQENMKQFKSYLHRLKKKDGEPLVVDTQIQILSTVRCFFEWLENGFFIDRNPMKGVNFPRSHRNRKLPNRGLTDDDIERLIGAIDVSKKLGIRDRALIHLILSSGVRLDECASLTINDLDFSDNRIEVIEGKGGADRITYFSETAAKWLQLYLTETRPKLGNARSGKGLFLSNKGSHMDKKTLGKLMRDLFDKAGVKGYGCTHRLRHTFTRVLVKSSVNIVSVKTLLGHDNLATTSRYVNLHSDDVEMDYKKASGF